MERYRDMKKDQLLTLAAQAGVKGRSRMTKTQLIEALSELDQAVEPMSEQVAASAAPPGPDVWSSPPVRDITPELPALLGKSRLVLLPQGPKTAFAYWELTGDADPGNLDLRIISSQTGAEVAVYRISGRTGSYYIRLESSGQEIEGLLGSRPGGVFSQILRSNRIRLPDDSPTEELPALWMTRKKDFEEIYRLSIGKAGAAETAWDHEEYRWGYPVFSWPGEPKKGLS